ncbi:GNAT family N-acetyltransferase [uncultured Legionella sp.]|uniref:GNAT family N-acetyltransferase n=1 Tax=uncultured Legionella sp. TaxID=210934 RepID=UPI0026251D61|nr:GNAT family N-acetyltransferase [uncultured Legionella sp.]
MKEITYHSKKLGTVLIASELNSVTIRTQRLEFRSLNQIAPVSLLTAYTNLLSDPENVALFGDGSPWDHERIKEYVTNDVKQRNSGASFGIFAVYHSESQKFIGTLEVTFVPDEYLQLGSGHANVAEISYVLDKSCWGQGYGTEMAIAAKKYIKHVVNELKNNASHIVPTEIVATVDPSNTGSKKILEKTLKNQEEEVFIKFGGKERILFFKPLHTPPTSEVHLDLTAKL